MRELEIAAPECCHQACFNQVGSRITTLSGRSLAQSALWCGHVFLTLLFGFMPGLLTKQKFYASSAH
jgi:hypothetical protein